MSTASRKAGLWRQGVSGETRFAGNALTVRMKALSRGEADASSAVERSRPPSAGLAGGAGRQESLMIGDELAVEPLADQGDRRRDAQDRGE